MLLIEPAFLPVPSLYRYSSFPNATSILAELLPRTARIILGSFPSVPSRSRESLISDVGPSLEADENSTLVGLDSPPHPQY